jgi:hypothetical protein
LKEGVVVEPSSRNLEPSRSSRGYPWLRLLISWLWVGLPLGWGVWQTAIKSLPLFDSFLRNVKL